MGLWKSCQKDKHVCDEGITITPRSIEYITDSIPKIVLIPAPEKVDSIIEVPVPQDVDTAKILAKFYAKHIYTRTFEDSNLKATIKDTISENKPSQAMFTYQLLKPTQIIVNNEINLKPVNKYFIGATARSDTSLSINAFMLTKKETLLGVGFDPFSKVVSATGAIKIFQKKNRKRK